jgi:hypothetical protein
LFEISGQYIQNQYELSASTAAIAAGIIAVPAAVSGQFFGGLICRQMALELRGMLRLCVIGATISLVFSVAVLGRCHLTPVAGVTMAYNGRLVGIAAASCELIIRKFLHLLLCCMVNA